MFLEIRVGDVHHVHQNVSFPNLVKCTLECLHKLGWEFSDESHGVTQQEWHIFDYHLPYCRVKGSEEFVLCKNVAFGQKVHQCAFADVSVSHK